MVHVLSFFRFSVDSCFETEGGRAEVTETSLLIWYGGSEGEDDVRLPH